MVTGISSHDDKEVRRACKTPKSTMAPHSMTRSIAKATTSIATHIHSIETSNVQTIAPFPNVNPSRMTTFSVQFKDANFWGCWVSKPRSDGCGQMTIPVSSLLIPPRSIIAKDLWDILPSHYCRTVPDQQQRFRSKFSLSRCTPKLRTTWASSFEFKRHHAGGWAGLRSLIFGCQKSPRSRQLVIVLRWKKVSSNFVLWARGLDVRHLSIIHMVIRDVEDGMLKVGASLGLARQKSKLFQLWAHELQPNPMFWCEWTLAWHTSILRLQLFYLGRVRRIGLIDFDMPCLAPFKIAGVSSCALPLTPSNLSKNGP